ncbi:unnamed protein product [Closterium sp. Naga37s-1]|nr:unnamed protein product [Closterium sp. Naga37s-1]
MDSEWINFMSPDWYPVKPIWQGTEQCVLEQKDLLLSLPRLWRMMLLSDGSVTRHLELLLGEQVTVDCVEMRGIGHALLGLPPGTALVPGPRVQRQVHLKPPSGEVLVYAASWWAAEEVKTALPAVQQPVWKTLQQQRTELFRSLERLYYGSSPHLERIFGVPGPFWARHYFFYSHGRPLTLIYEAFSPRLDAVLGDSSHDGVLQCPANNSSAGDLVLPALEAGAVAAGTARRSAAVPCRQQHGRPLPPSPRGRRGRCRHRSCLSSPLVTLSSPDYTPLYPFRHDGVLQCPADNSTGDLFLPALEAGAVAAGTVPWHTTRGKFLLLHCVRGQVGGCWGRLVSGQVGASIEGQGRFRACWGRWAPCLGTLPGVHCVRGQISNRVLCIKNHLLLAGLLSRTLIVPFHHSEVVRNYNMHVALDVEHLRRCFGKVVFTTAEYRRKYVKPINVTEVVCWHGPKGACREEDKELLLNCPAPETMNTPASVLVGGDGEALRKHHRKYRRKYVKPTNVTEVVCWHGPKGACREEDKELLLNCPAPEIMNTPASVLVGGDGEALRKVQWWV